MKVVAGGVREPRWVPEMRRASALRVFALSYVDFRSPLRLLASLTRFALAREHQCPPSARREASGLACVCSSRRRRRGSSSGPVLRFWGKRNVSWDGNVAYIWYSPDHSWKPICFPSNFMIGVVAYFVLQATHNWWFFKNKRSQGEWYSSAMICLQTCSHSCVYA